jgi:GNAT superfamily N-acetyltransferase
VTLRTFGPDLVPGVLALWARRWGALFPLDLALWRQNTDGDPGHFNSDRCWVIEHGGAVEGCLCLKVPSHPPAWDGQDPQQGWFSFLVVSPGRERDLVRPLADAAFGALRAAGLTRVRYGADPSHFFPGAPESDPALCASLQEIGFRPGEPVHDLAGDLRRLDVPDGVGQALRREGADVRACARSDVPELFAFLDRHFPGRWAYETRQRLDVEPGPSDVLLLTRAGEIAGFCHVYHGRSRRIGPSIYWRKAIGDRCGGLGPIGIASDLRGRGLGSALLVLALRHLRGLGIERAVIDWTTLTDLYGRFGFDVWRTYRPWRLALEPS